MELTKILSTYFVSLVVFLGIDFVWLAVIAKNMYAQKIGHLMAEKPNLVAALIFYLIYIFGLVILVIMPALKAQSASSALLMGALFGLVAYATYDLTNLATLKSWPLDMTIIDLIWGSVLTAVVSVVTFYIFKGRLY